MTEPTELTTTAPDRTSKALHGVDLAGRGLEIGPSYSPLMPKSSGRRIDTIDHAPREELLEKYRALGLADEKLAQIDEVDFLWHGGSLVDVVPELGVYDYIIASHFIEHTVDLIGFFQDCETLLSETGRLALVVPDKRYTFDFFRPLTSLGTIVEAHTNPTRYHPPSAVIDHVAYVAKKDNDVGWTQGDRRPIEIQNTDLHEVPELVSIATAQEEYLDRHRWVFTPTWFELLVNDLSELGHIDLEIVESFETEGIEFFATLARRTSETPPTDRLETLIRVDQELSEASLSDNSRRLAIAEAENAGLRQEVELLRASTSWRITRPLRAVATRLRRG